MTIVTPADSAILHIPDSLRVSASDESGVVRVAVFDLDRQTQVAADSTAPFVMPFDPPGPDTLHLAAAAWDPFGHQGESAPVTVFVPVADVAAPEVVITSPAPGEMVTVQDSIYVDATDDRAVAAVQVLLDGVVSVVDSVAPYVFPVELPWLRVDSLTIGAVAHDYAGCSGVAPEVRVAVDPGPPYSVPEPLAPEDGVEFQTDSPVTFLWRNQSAPHFQFELAEDEDFATLLHSEVLGDTAIAVALSEYRFYYWRVRAGFADGPWSPWSETRGFRLLRSASFDGEFLVASSLSRGNALALAPDGGLLLTGGLGDDLLALNLDPDDSIRWFTLRVPYWLSAVTVHAVQAGAQGWFLTAYNAAGPPHGYPSLWHLGPGGDMQLVQYWPGYEFQPLFVQQGDENHVFAVLEDLSDWPHNVDYPLKKVSIDGNTIWQITCGHSWTAEMIASKSRRPRDLLCSAESEPVIPTRYESWDNYQYPWLVDVSCTAYNPAEGDTLWNLVLASDAWYEGSEGGLRSMDLGQGVLGANGTLYILGLLDTQTVLWRIAPDHQSFDYVPVPELAWGEAHITEAVGLLTGDLAFVGGVETGGSKDAIAFCLSPEGQLLWRRVLGDPGVDDYFNDAVVGSDGTLAAIGTSKSGGYPEGRLWLRRFDPAGDEVTPEH